MDAKRGSARLGGTPVAKSTKTPSKKSAKPDVAAEVQPDVEDAVVVLEEDATEKALAEEVKEALSEEPVAEEEAGADDEAVTSADDQSVEEALVVEEASAPAPVVTENVTVQKVGFAPLVGGGVLAAGLGYFAAWSGYGQNTEDFAPLLAEQTARIEALDETVAALPPVPELPEMPDLAPLEAQISELRETAEAQLGGLGEQLAGLDSRLTAVERAPAGDGTVSNTAITSIERELDGLRTEIAAQQARIQEMADQAAADLAAAQAQTAAIEAEAQAAAEAAQAEAEAAMIAAAVAEVRIAMETGEPFEPALSDLQATGIAVPEALAAVAVEGLPTQTALTEVFPDLARAALATARAEGVGQEDGGGLGSFLRNQFNVRSVEPREGDDPDAVLSRAEAALRGGDLGTTIAEIAALPDPVKAGFADWLATAQARTDALAAVATLDPSVSN